MQKYKEFFDKIKFQEAEALSNAIYSPLVNSNAQTWNKYAPILALKYLEDKSSVLKRVLSSEDVKPVSAGQNKNYILLPFSQEFSQFLRKTHPEITNKGLSYGVLNTAPGATAETPTGLKKAYDGIGANFSNALHCVDPLDNNNYITNIAQDFLSTERNQAISTTAIASPVSADTATNFNTGNNPDIIRELFMKRFLPVSSYPTVGALLQSSGKLAVVQDKQNPQGFLIGFPFLVPTAKKIAKSLGTSEVFTSLLAKVYNPDSSNAILNTTTDQLKELAQDATIVPQLFNIDLPENQAILQFLAKNVGNAAETQKPVESYHTFTSDQLNATEKALQKIVSKNVLPNQYLYKPLSELFGGAKPTNISVRQSLGDFKGFSEKTSAIKMHKLLEAFGESTNISTAAFSIRFTFDKNLLQEAPDDDSEVNLQDSMKYGDFFRGLFKLKEEDAKETEKQNTSENEKTSAVTGLKPQDRSVIKALQQTRNNIVQYLASGNKNNPSGDAFGKIKVNGAIFFLNYLPGPDSAIRVLNKYTAEVPVLVEKTGERKTIGAKLARAAGSTAASASRMTIGQAKNL